MWSNIKLKSIQNVNSFLFLDYQQALFSFKHDFESKQWNNGTELSVARAYHACASFETDAIYVVGGWGPSNADATDSVEFSVINQDLVTVGEWTEDEGMYFLAFWASG